MKLKRVGVVYKKSSLQLYTQERNDKRLTKLIKEDHHVAGRLIPSHKNHMQALDRVDQILQDHQVKADFIYRSRPFVEAEYDLILTLGGDGTFLEASHRIHKTPILGINSSPKDSVGIFCGICTEELGNAIERIRKNSFSKTKVTRLKAVLGKRILPFPVLNDVLITHANPAATSRYLIKVGRREEEQKSSGIWVAPASGATAAIGAAGGKMLPMASSRFQYRVRELYWDSKQRTSLVGGLLNQKAKFKVTSKMRAGRVFLDGPHSTFVFPIGEVLEISTGASPLTIFGVSDERRKKRFSK